MAFSGLRALAALDRVAVNCGHSRTIVITAAARCLPYARFVGQPKMNRLDNTLQSGAKR